VDNKLENYAVQQERKGRRDLQRSHFYRNQALGLLIAAGAVLLYRLFHIPTRWLFPQGWWRLW